MIFPFTVTGSSSMVSTVKWLKLSSSEANPVVGHGRGQTAAEAVEDARAERDPPPPRAGRGQRPPPSVFRALNRAPCSMLLRLLPTEARTSNLSAWPDEEPHLAPRHRRRIGRHPRRHWLQAGEVEDEEPVAESPGVRRLRRGAHDGAVRRGSRGCCRQSAGRWGSRHLLLARLFVPSSWWRLARPLLSLVGVTGRHGGPPLHPVVDRSSLGGRRSPAGGRAGRPEVWAST